MSVKDNKNKFTNHIMESVESTWIFMRNSLIVASIESGYNEYYVDISTFNSIYYTYVPMRYTPEVIRLNTYIKLQMILDVVGIFYTINNDKICIREIVFKDKRMYDNTIEIMSQLECMSSEFRFTNILDINELPSETHIEVLEETLKGQNFEEYGVLSIN